MTITKNRAALNVFLSAGSVLALSVWLHLSPGVIMFALGLLGGSLLTMVNVIQVDEVPKTAMELHRNHSQL